MKKIYLAVFLACTMGGAAHAQISEGGIPWSMSLQNDVIKGQDVAKVELPAPDYDRYRKEDEQDALAGIAKPYRVEARVYCDIDINNSGTWYYLEDGRKIWRAVVTIPEAQALDFFYDKFTLPQGVRYFLTNESGTQLLGAYTIANKNEFNSFTNDQVQGNTARIELNIPAGVDPSSIDFHIHRIGAGYRGFENLNRIYGAANNLAERPTDASPCHRNANCPEGDGEAWTKAKNATVRINIDDAGWCSGTMINNTGNAAGGACIPYLLTASHCDSPNAHDDEHFANWKFNFNYQYTTCEGPAVSEMQTRTGAYFRARSYYPTFPTPANSLVADFLLLELKSPPQPTTNAYLAGWNRASSFSDELEDYQFVGFHHPAGDVKKLSRSNFVDVNGTFNQTVVSGTHWTANYTVGGSEGGSSGSGFFDKNGLLIGDLSGGPNGTGDCAPMGYTGEYSKFTYAWNNEFDQTAFPEFAGAKSRLKDWLDPAGLNPMTLVSAKYDCSDISSIDDVESQLSSSIFVYPNPSSNGVVTIRLNFDVPHQLELNVVDVTGAVRKSYSIPATSSAEHTLDLSSLASGMYMLNFVSKEASVSKKVIIQ